MSLPSLPIYSAVTETLFYLVRVAMGNEAPKPINKAVDWNTLLEYANRQGVAAITFDAIERLFDAGVFDFNNITEGGLLHANWYGSVTMQEHMYKLHESAIAKLNSFYAKHSIDMMVLKGYGLSLNYPQPSHRPCGDIDIWLRGKQKGADELLASKMGIIPHKSSHHTLFEVEGCEVENHITILEHDTHKSNIRIDRFLTKLANESDEVINMNGKRLLLPTAEFNSYFILRHNAIHFIVDGITIRHLLDWATFVARYSMDINWDALNKFAEENNMDKFLNCMNAICIDFLGFKTESFPVRNRNEALEKRILNDILHSEFDEEIPDRHRHFAKYCYVKTKRLWANRWKSKITNTDSFLSEFICYAKNRIKEDLTYRRGNV